MIVSQVITSNLEEASILAQTEREHLPLNDPMVVHHIKDGFLVRRVGRLGQTQNAIYCLSVEEVSLFGHTAKGKVEGIQSRVVAITKVNSVFH